MPPTRSACTRSILNRIAKAYVRIGESVSVSATAPAGTLGAASASMV